MQDYIPFNHILRQQHLSVLKLIGEEKLLAPRGDLITWDTSICCKDIFKGKFPFPLQTTVILKKIINYLRATGTAFQREIIKGNEQALIQGNKNLVNAINIVWIVAGISRTSQDIILY